MSAGTSRHPTRLCYVVEGIGFTLVAAGYDRKIAPSEMKRTGEFAELMKSLKISSSHRRERYGNLSVASIENEIIPCHDFSEVLDDAMSADTWIFAADAEAAKAASRARDRRVPIPSELQITGLEDRPS